MTDSRWFRFTLFALAISCATSSFAVCMNKYVFHSPENAKQELTLLTGKLTFQEAKDLAKAISEKKAPPLEWVDANGKLIARQFGNLRVVRPMPVGCDDRSSGVVVAVTFFTVTKPSGQISVKLGTETAVPFEEQKE